MIWRVLSGGASNESTSKLSSSISSLICCSLGASVVVLSPNTDRSWSVNISSLVIDGHDDKSLTPKIKKKVTKNYIQKKII